MEANKFRKKLEFKNRIASWLVSAGGYAVIGSLVLMFLFLVYQVIPLWQGGEFEEFISLDIKQPKSPIILSGLDPYLVQSYHAYQNGEIRFFELKTGSLLARDTLPLFPQERILSWYQYPLKSGWFAVGTDSGRILTVQVKFENVYAGDRRETTGKLSLVDVFRFTAPQDSIPAHVEKLTISINEEGKISWAWMDHENLLHVRIFDPAEEEYYSAKIDFNDDGPITAMALDAEGEKLILGNLNGELYWYDLSDPEDVFLKEHWKASAAPVTALQFLIGGNSLIVGSSDGEVIDWFPVRNAEQEFKFVAVQAFQSHSSAVAGIVPSGRNRTFMTYGVDGTLQVHYSTTGKTALRERLSSKKLRTVAFSAKGNAVILTDEDNRQLVARLDYQHPEISLKTLFGKVHYEGYPGPAFVWQSTGGSDEFEPKFSLVPLIFGTFKGTLYAMLFSVPLALLAAIYVSQFAPRRLSRVIKPTIEIMAALPSVVVGLLAGLYFSPVFEEQLWMITCFLLLLIIMTGVVIFITRYLSAEIRMRLPRGWELLYMLSVLAIAWTGARMVAPGMEQALFQGNFTHWLYDHWNLSYDQRNSLVVGFALGFAVVPIIFTISEDALSNVPESLTSAALALGASRWQTVRRIVLPAAAGGIFSAIMLGLGRAIGETMIVLMATGNTPILDLSPFNGFRAMSACIAVEIPEAPVGGTLYRVLFLTALLLFLFTFVLNSVASMVGDRLRKKYARF
ncbi:MAG: ABC transporter permease subunit [Calditrichia bacterium]